MAVRRTLSLVNRQGLHARPISQFVELVKQAGATVRVTGPDGTVADGGSVFSMMTLAAGHGARLELEAEGPGAAELVERLERLVADGFGEL